MSAATTPLTSTDNGLTGPSMPAWYKKRSNQAILVVLLVMVLLLALVLNRHQPTAPVHTVPTPEISQVTITKDGFAPNTVTVKAGNIVEWTSSDDSGTHIVAANPFKTHTELPSLISTQLGQGAIYRYKFTKAGTYHYHDEVNPQLNGTVIVK